MAPSFIIIVIVVTHCHCTVTTMIIILAITIRGRDLLDCCLTNGIAAGMPCVMQATYTAVSLGST
jgi:hypothetical protein